MRLAVEVEGLGEVGALPGGGASLAAFMSFAVSRGFGAQHPLIAMAELASRQGIAMGPLTTFYERIPEDAEDVAKLELAWQDAAELLESVTSLVRLLETSPEAATFPRRAKTESLADELRALGVTVGEAAERGTRVRLSYEL